MSNNHEHKMYVVYVNKTQFTEEERHIFFFYFLLEKEEIIGEVSGWKERVLKIRISH